MEEVAEENEPCAVRSSSATASLLSAAHAQPKTAFLHALNAAMHPIPHSDEPTRRTYRLPKVCRAASLPPCCCTGGPAA